jgi:hypothetical protein
MKESATSAVAPESLAIRIRDEVWIATALLHTEHPDEPDFESRRIRERLRRENLAGRYRGGVDPHITVHCVANRAPVPMRVRFLFATGRSRRRLFRPGDPSDPARSGQATCPDRSDIPARYHPLLDWYKSVYAAAGRPAADGDPILALRGRGKQLAGGESPDEYVRRLREGW